MIGIGEKKTPSTLRNACDRFTFLEPLEKDETVAAIEEEKSVEAHPSGPQDLGTQDPDAPTTGASEAAMLRTAV
ncbi:hypothetical protein [Arthrobacter sp. 49Tsu3.1M3]|uniref:hypothetical protein n=1 Tax=Arthrobacter sp. 49Tsu3.1M3 TaxID=1279029 RepID=UPI0009A5ABE2|nr:hypothetical protein [Arthrobacter sp. 49Tsu3.1M3]